MTPGERARGASGVAWRAGLHVVLPLVLGVIAYVAWRTSEVRVVTWLPRGVVGALRGTVGRVPLPNVISGSLPDAAWAWAFGAALALVWAGRPRREKAAWLGAGAALAIGVELGQGAGVVPGTFDLLDVASIAVGYALGVLVASRHRLPHPAPIG